MAEDGSGLREMLSFHGVEDAAQKAQSISRYMELLLAKRRWAGLTSRSLVENPAEMVNDSVGAAAILAKTGKIRAADVGAGGGLLGIIVAICEPGIEVSCVEAASRKASFMTEAIGALELKNAHVRKTRAEQLIGRADFDVVMSRAAGRLKEMLPLAFALLESGGLYCGLKSSEPEQEIAEAQESMESAGGHLLRVEKILIPGAESNRPRASLVLFEKL